MLSVHLEGWDIEGGRETQEGGGMWIYVCITDSLCITDSVCTAENNTAL